MEDLRVEIVDELQNVSEAGWNALASPDDPFTDIRFLRALESSGSVGPETGWSPCHVLVYQGENMVAAMPLYAKDHSYGEYIFDWGWANTSHRAGIPYYPKLVSAVPFTPATSTRILHGTVPLSPEIEQALQAGWKRVAQDLEIMSAHVLFTTEEQHLWLEESWEFIRRLTYQFHWENKGWKTFEDFTQALRSPVRKQIRKERKKARESGCKIQLRRGTELSDEEWNMLYPLYRSTTDAKGAIPYLTPEFFSTIRETYGDHLVLCSASHGDSLVAGSISFQKGNHLYGRYWGCLGQMDFLHFELCYYQLIEMAIGQGYQRFEAGAQGRHKLKRGLLPAPTYSAHWIRHKGLADAISNYVEEEAENTRAEIEYFMKKSPFRRDCTED